MSLLFTNRPARNPASIQEVLSAKASKRRGFVRILETFRWFNAVAEKGAGDLYSHEFAENCRIRLVHAHIRSAIVKHQGNWNYQPDFGWDQKLLGVPLSAADGSIVVSTILVTLLAMRRHLHKAISEEELEALNHWCNYVSFLQGVPEELLCPRYQDTVVQLAAFFMSMDTRLHHHELRSFMAELQELGLGRGLFRKFKPLGVALDEVAAAALDDAFDEGVKQHFAIRRASRRAHFLFGSCRRLIIALNRVAGMSGRVNDVLDAQTVRLWRTVIPQAERVLARLHGKVVG